MCRKLHIHFSYCRAARIIFTGATLTDSHARGHPEGSGNGRQHGDDQVQDFLNEFFFHGG